jgi:hypothetical protein
LCGRRRSDPGRAGGPAGGGFDGINSQLDVYIDAGYIVSAMCHSDSGASALANKIGTILARAGK